MLCGVGILALPAAVTARRVLLRRIPVFLAPHPQSPGADYPIRQYHDPVNPHRLDAWEIIGPGGGGAFYHPAISPHDPGLVFATSDMTQCFVSENAGLTWREFNLRNTCRFAFDARLPGRVYADAGVAGLYRSDDRGRTWNLVYPHPHDLTGIWYGEDEGEPSITGSSQIPWIQAFAVDPENSNALYAVIGDQLHVSTDSGRNWEGLAPAVGARALYVEPHSPPRKRTVYVVGYDSIGVWNGARYTNCRIDDAPARFSAYGFGSTAGRSVLYTVSDFNFKDGQYKNGGIMASEDGGASWHSLNQGLLKMVARGRYPTFAALAVSRRHPEVVYVSYYGLFLPGDPNAYFGVAKVTGYGATWSFVWKEAGTAAANVHDSWTTARYQPDFGAYPTGLAVDDNNPDLVYATDLARVMRTADGGRNWEALYSQALANGNTTTGLDVTTCYGLHFDPFDPGRMFVGYTDIGLFRSENGGRSWISSTTRGVPRPWVNTTYWLEFDPAVRGRMWAVMSGTHDLPRMRMFKSRGSTAQFHGGVLLSTDGGKSWRVSSQGLPDMAATHILLDPRSPVNARVLYVAGFGRGVFKSADGGRTWNPSSKGLPENEPLTWRMARDRDGVLYVVVIRRSEDGQYGTNQDGGLYRSRNDGESWEAVPLPPGLNGPVGIAVSPQDPQRLYLAAWGRYTQFATGSLAPQGGVFVSSDGGEHWTNTLDAMRRAYDVTVDPRDPDVVYATGFEAAAWRSGDRGRTWTRIRGFNFKDGHRIVPDPADRSKIYITTFGSSVWHGPATGDPQATEDIVGPRLMTFEGQTGRRAP